MGFSIRRGPDSSTNRSQETAIRYNTLRPFRNNKDGNRSQDILVAGKEERR